MLKCRVCNTKINNTFLSLGKAPLSNSYLSYENLDKAEIFFPLDLYFCPKCFLVQIVAYEKIENIFSADYAYHSSYSKSWLYHCKKYTNFIIEKFSLNESSFVMEIASNDGYLLQYFKEKNIPCLGVEPAKGVAKVAIEKGINTDITFFDIYYAQYLTKKPDLMIANNVLAHNPKLDDFVKGFKLALNDTGVITMEFPHLLQLIKNNQFDTIYHEHYSYFSLNSAKYLFEKHDLEIFDVEELETHGGSLRLYIKHKNDLSKKISESVEILIKKEVEFGLTNSDFYLEFKNKVEKVKRDLLKTLIELKNQNKKIVGYGAPAKGNTLLNYCGIRTDFIEYTVDLNPNKQNKFLPCTNIPIFSPEKIAEDKPDYILILPWNIKEEIIKQLFSAKEWGCKFIVPIPNLEIL